MFFSDERWRGSGKVGGSWKKWRKGEIVVGMTGWVEQLVSVNDTKGANMAATLL